MYKKSTIKGARLKELKKAGIKAPKVFIRRTLISKIVPWLKRDEIIIITGPRQVGKTTLLYQIIIDHLLPKNSSIYYFNLDIPKHKTWLENTDYLISLADNNKKKTYVFIDEIQRMNEPGLFLKGIYDLHLPMKLIVTGSSSLEIKSKVQEALTGRKKVFHLNPFNLVELSKVFFPNNTFNKIIINKNSFSKVLNEYLIYGGYPAVSLESDINIKVQILSELFTSYIEKDIKSFLKVENNQAFRNLIKILASQIGNLMNKEEISNTLDIHKNTLDNYLFYLEQTFMLNFLRPYHKNIRKEILKSPKVYFHDLGIRNFAVGTFSDFEFRSDKGRLFENFAYLLLKEKVDIFSDINFWRTKQGAEVDFIINNDQIIPIEVKAAILKNLKISKSMRSFINIYKPEKGYYLNLSQVGKIKIDKTAVNFLTPAELIASAI